jgi:acyl dehydratase
MTKIRPRGFPVERGKVHEFADAILDPHPHYHDEEAARAAGLPGVVAPPTFLMAASLFEGSTPASPDAVSELDMRFALHGAQDIEFERPLLAGDRLVAEIGETRSYEKGGAKGGRMKFVEIEMVFRDQAGDVVARSRATAIQTQGVVDA